MNLSILSFSKNIKKLTLSFENKQNNNQNNVELFVGDCTLG